jgi:hypothetical protein
MTLRPIDPNPFVKAAGTLPPLDVGKQPFLQWIDVKQLVVDGSYQRDIGAAGKKNIIRIAREFDWARFATVVVASADKGKFVIVDGQHRVTAAALRGLPKVPCQIIVGDTPKQALAFAAINANVTKMSTMQLHAARVAANDPEAVRLKKVCEAGGVTLLRYPLDASKQKVGDSMAVVQLRQALDRYGEKALRLALLCITRHGNVGMVRGLLVQALCGAIESEQTWLNHPRLVAAFENFDFKETFAAAGRSVGGYSRSAVLAALAGLISKHLAFALDGKTAAADKSSAIAKPVVAASTARAPEMAGVTNAGIDVDIESGRITFRRQAIRLPQWDALLVALLARATPNPVGYDFLAKRVWAKQRVPDEYESALDQKARVCAVPLRSIGLEVVIAKNVGIAVREIA